MIELEDITTDYFTSVSFKIEKGTVCKIITNSDQERRSLLDTILAFCCPEFGKVYLLEKDICSLKEDESLEVFKKLSVVWRYGGLLSNLTVLDNIILPNLYHKKEVAEDVVDKVCELLSYLRVETSCFTEYLSRFSGTLPLHEKRVIGFIRAIITDPDLIIYDSIFEGFNTEIKNKLLSITEEFHSANSSRTSVYLDSNELSVIDIKADLVLQQNGRNFVK